MERRIVNGPELLKQIGPDSQPCGGSPESVTLSAPAQGNGGLRAWAGVHTVHPRTKARVAAAERLVLHEDRVEPVVVALGEPEHGVLQERERDHVGDAELVAQDEVAAVQQRLEAIERSPELCRR